MKRQKELPITVILGNPPYSAKQGSENDDNQNLRYINLDKRIHDTYVRLSKANATHTLYDSYIKAFRWATDRISNGVVAFVSNGSFIDNQSTDGFRKALFEEFNHLYIFNLRGDQRTQGETSRREGGKIFGSGSRTPIAISILVKDGSDNHNVYYHDIGDYLSRTEKLKILSDSESISGINWHKIEPDMNDDWVNQRDGNYLNYKAISPDIFCNKAIGVQTKRDSWAIGFNKRKVRDNIHRMIDNYNEELGKLVHIIDGNTRFSMVSKNEQKIKWSDELKRKFERGENLTVDDDNLVLTMYRPFTKKWLYYDRAVVARPGRYAEIFSKENQVIYTTGTGAKGGFSSILLKEIPDANMMSAGGQGYPLYDNEAINNTNKAHIYNVNSHLGIDMDEIFYYVYGLLNSKQFIELYSADLQKALPRIPLVKNKEKYIEVGHKLADLHLNYELQESWKGVEVVSNTDYPSYKVSKMKHPKKDLLDKIIYNDQLTVTNIPEKAYEYVVNGRPAIEWIIDQYRVKTDKKSGITDDPNDFSEDPKYILNLLLSIITVSMKTLELIDELPEFEVVE